MKTPATASLLLSLFCGSAHALKPDPVGIQYTVVIKSNDGEAVHSVLTTVDGKEIVASFTNTTATLDGSNVTGYYISLTPMLQGNDSIHTRFVIEKREETSSKLSSGDHHVTLPAQHIAHVESEVLLRDGEKLSLPYDQKTPSFATVAPEQMTNTSTSSHSLSITARKL